MRQLPRQLRIRVNLKLPRSNRCPRLAIQTGNQDAKVGQNVNVVKYPQPNVLTVELTTLTLRVVAGATLPVILDAWDAA